MACPEIVVKMPARRSTFDSLCIDGTFQIAYLLSVRLVSCCLSLSRLWSYLRIGFEKYGVSIKVTEYARKELFWLSLPAEAWKL